MTGAEAGQVWERVAGGGVLRRPELEAAAATDVQEARDLAQQADGRAAGAQTLAEQADTKAERASNALGNLHLSTLNTRSQADGPQFVDGNRWVWQPGGTPNGGTVVSAADGGMWMREVSGALTPEMFGAAGDGVTDDTAAIIAVMAASTNQVVEYRRPYLIKPTSTINVPASSTHRMSGAGRLILGANTQLGTDAMTLRYVLTILTDDVHLENWVMDGQRTLQTHRLAGIVAYNARRPRLVRPRLYAWTGFGYLLQNCPGALVDDATVTDCGMMPGMAGEDPAATAGGAVGMDANLTPADPYYAAGCIVRGGTYSYNGLDGLSMSTPGGRAEGITALHNGQGDTVQSLSIGAAGIYYLAGADTTITGCTAAYNSGNGIDTGPNSSLVPRVKILNNTCFSNGSAGIQADDVAGVVIEGNTCFNNGQRGFNNQKAGIILASFGQVQGATIRNNRCYDDQGNAQTQTWGLGVGTSLTGGFSISNLLIEGNDFAGNKLGAIGSDAPSAPYGLVTSGYISARRNLGHLPNAVLPAGNTALNPINEYMFITPQGAGSTITFITPGRQGDMLILKSLGNTVTLKATGGNLALMGGTDKALGAGQTATLLYDGGAWSQVAGG
ncbi:right-handed parallel beta-helix repeat-containing protein [Deinococcus actinosclerus]|nr:right-handed parallel beta-helix repeat-containing protein [Deinococcus actinosclerus]